VRHCLAALDDRRNDAGVPLDSRVMKASAVEVVVLAPRARPGLQQDPGEGGKVQFVTQMSLGTGDEIPMGSREEISLMHIPILCHT